MRRVLAVATIVLALGVGLGTTCGRGSAVESGVSYSIDAVNTGSQPVIVYFDDGTGPRLLGTVEADSRERFIVAGTESETVTVLGRRETDTVRRTVTLQRGEPVVVRF